MNKIYKDNFFTIRGAPFFRFNNVENGNILVKIELKKISFRVKCRISANMVWTSEKKRKFTKNTELIESTNSNTGITLDYVADARNYKLTLTMPDTISIKSKKLLKFSCSHLILTDGKYSINRAISKDKKIQLYNSKKYLSFNQFDNPETPKIHQKNTGPKILNDTNRQIDVLISSIETWGTITGITRYIKKIKEKESLISIPLKPSKLPVITQYVSGKPIHLGMHKTQVIGCIFIPGNLNLALINQVISVSSEESIFFTQKLIKYNAILSGISSIKVVLSVLKIQSQKKIF